MIYINQVFQYINDSKRMRVIEIQGRYVYSIDIDAHTSMLKMVFYFTLATEIQQKKLCKPKIKK